VVEIEPHNKEHSKLNQFKDTCLNAATKNYQKASRQSRTKLTYFQSSNETVTMSMKEVIPHYKVVLLGEGRVGKTSILLRFVEDSYVEGCPSTTSASYLEKHVIVDEHQTTPRREANLSIWDTAGQERFHSLGPIYYRDAKGAVLVYDITDASTFDRVKSWTKELRKMVGDKTKICLTIVGNKLDLELNRVVSVEEATKYASSVGATFFETSAKTGRGVEDVFVFLTKTMLDTVKPSYSRSGSTLMDASNNMMGSGNDLHNIDLSRREVKNSSCCSG
jgi:Ras-related protein Rab-21